MKLRCPTVLALFVLMGANSAQAQPPSAPTGLIATGGDQMVTLSWNATIGADYYYVYRASTSGGPYFSIGYVYETTLDDYGDWDDYGTYPLIHHGH